MGCSWKSALFVVALHLGSVWGTYQSLDSPSHKECASCVSRLLSLEARVEDLEILRSEVKSDIDVIRSGLKAEKEKCFQLSEALKHCICVNATRDAYIDDRLDDFHATLLNLSKTVMEIKLNCWTGTPPAVKPGCPSSVVLYSKLVFDPTFYVNFYGDLHQFTTVAAARNHWLTYGIKEGRQGCGSFHSVQYLQRYPDLQKAFGKNYRQAIEHYLRYGYCRESRLGYIDGGAGGRWTISNKDQTLFLSSANRTAGAVDSLVWNNKEFINSWDHGRQMQMAINTDQYERCFNPTEAGSLRDGFGSASTSQIVYVRSGGASMDTANRPAFWLHPGEKAPVPTTGICAQGSPAVNKVNVYNYEFSKHVTIGCAGMENCIKFVSNFTVGGQWPEGIKGYNFEAPRGYLTNDFTVKLNFDLATGETHGFSNNRMPVILSTPDSHYAMGVYAPTGQDSDSFQYYNLKSYGNNFASGTNLWDVVFRKNKFPDGITHHLVYTTYACVGSIDMVKCCLYRVSKAYPSL